MVYKVKRRHLVIFLLSIVFAILGGFNESMSQGSSSASIFGGALGGFLALPIWVFILDGIIEWRDNSTTRTLEKVALFILFLGIGAAVGRLIGMILGAGAYGALFKFIETPPTKSKAK